MKSSSALQSIMEGRPSFPLPPPGHSVPGVGAGEGRGPWRSDGKGEGQTRERRAAERPPHPGPLPPSGGEGEEYEWSSFPYPPRNASAVSRLARRAAAVSVKRFRPVART